VTEDKLKEIEAEWSPEHATKAAELNARYQRAGLPAASLVNSFNDLLQQAHKDIPDLVAALREARQLLGALVPTVSPSIASDTQGAYMWLCCHGPYLPDFEPHLGHNFNCPWLLAKQYLEPPQP
jgi:hypothetical protein